MSERNSRRIITGVVTSVSGAKSVKVTYDFKRRHALYTKEVKQKTVVHAHDEKSECGVGDRVVIAETRPLSKMKRFRIVEIVKKAESVS